MSWRPPAKFASSSRFEWQSRLRCGLWYVCCKCPCAALLSPFFLPLGSHNAKEAERKTSCIESLIQDEPLQPFLHLGSFFWIRRKGTIRKYASMGFIHAELLSNHITSCRSMLISVKVSYWMFLGFPSSDELASLDSASAC